MKKHLIVIKYVSPTDSYASKVKLTSQRFPKDSITFGYDHEFNGTFDNGLAILAKLGYTVYCSGEMPDAYWACVNEFEPLKEMLSEYTKEQKAGSKFSMADDQEARSAIAKATGGAS